MLPYLCKHYQKYLIINLLLLEQINNGARYIIDRVKIPIFWWSDEYRLIEEVQSSWLFLLFFQIPTQGDKGEFFTMVFVNEKMIIKNSVAKSFVQEYVWKKLFSRFSILWGRKIIMRKWDQIAYHIQFILNFGIKDFE